MTDEFVTPEQFNIYDDIREFYEADKGWDRYLQQAYVEELIRLQAFQGKSDAELEKLWNHIVQLVIYAGNAELMLGDMSHENLIDCIAWCGRNIAQFRVNYKTVDEFLEAADTLLRFLKQQHAITDDSAARKCRAKLLAVPGKVALIEEDGTFEPGYEGYTFNGTPDLPCKVFGGSMNRIDALERLLHRYFNQEEFAQDRWRAHYLFYDLVPQLNDKNDDPQMKEQLFWDYFLFDYQLIADGMTPLRHYYEYYLQQHPDDDENWQDLLEVLLTTRLYLFTVVNGRDDAGFMVCEDFLTGNQVELNLPYEVYPDPQVLYMAHAFSDGTVFTNYLHGLHISEKVQRRLYEVYEGARAWFMVQHPTASDWAEFVRMNPLLVMQVAEMYSRYVLFGSFTRQTQVEGYLPARPRPQDPVLEAVAPVLVSLRLPYRDCQLVCTLWADFMRARARAKKPVEAATGKDLLMWCGALLATYMSLSHTYQFGRKDFLRFTGIQEHELAAREAELHEALQLEDYDPRYINEEGLLMLALQ